MKLCDDDPNSAPLSFRTSAKHLMENRLSGLTSQKRINSGLERYSHEPRTARLIKKWKSMTSGEGYILRSINRHEYFGNNLHPASIGIILKALQKDLKMDSNEQQLSGHSFRVGAALDLLEQGEPLERIMLRGGWQTDSTAISYLRNWIV